jgi:hypothetical protein
MEGVEMKENASELLEIVQNMQKSLTQMQN